MFTDYYPKRIVCLTEETCEMLYLLGEEDRIAGISVFTVRPERARKEKPKVSAFTSAKIDKILALKPDLVLGFSDLQAEIASDLIKKGIEVYIFNQRSVKEILRMILTLGALVGSLEKAQKWVEQIETKITNIKAEIAQRNLKPKVYFEEWNDPIITGIGWVSELIEIAGGQECFPECASQSLAKNRIVENPLEVVKRNPDIILASWCGRKFRPQELYKRPEWNRINAVQNKQVFEINSEDILQPGPAALTDGLDQIKTIIDAWYFENTKT
jgi:iron complex transport system substrate-binding protein